MFKPHSGWYWLLLVLPAFMLWNSTNVSSPTQQKLNVVVTTNIIGDVVRNVAGDLIELTVLLPINADAHTFEPAPRDIAGVVDADVVFVNGFNFEQRLLVVIGNATEHIRLISVSAGITPRKFEQDELVEIHKDKNDADVDPHVWLDPNNVIAWVENIRLALSQADPDHADIYTNNAKRYRQALVELDRWVQDQVAQIPESKRRLVTDHAVYGYFADRYGFEWVGALIPGFSTMAEPSAGELAQLEDAIRRFDVKAIFVGTTVNPALAQQLAEDTGVQLVFVFTGSLSAENGPAGSYLDYVRFNVSAIVNALKG